MTGRNRAMDGPDVGNGTFEVQQRFLYDTNVINRSYDEVVLIIDETSGTTPDNSIEHRYLNGPLPDQVFSVQHGTGEIRWYLQDRQNTVTDIFEFSDSNSDGHHDQAAILNHLEYDAFGNITSQSDTGYQPLQTYTGQILDDVTGLMYYDARWFDPNVNQFLNDDPMGFAAGDTNLRRYVENSNPNATDPTGLMEVRVGGVPTPFPALDGDTHSSAEISAARHQLAQLIAKLTALQQQLHRKGQMLDRQRRALERDRSCDKAKKQTQHRIAVRDLRHVKEVLNQALANARIAEHQWAAEEKRARWREYRALGRNPRVENRHEPVEVRTEQSILDKEIVAGMQDIVIELTGLAAGIGIARRGLNLADDAVRCAPNRGLTVLNREFYPNGAISNIGPAARRMNARHLADLPDGQAVSGVMNLDSGRFLGLRNRYLGEATALDGSVVRPSVMGNAGHGQVERALTGALGTDSTRNVGFTLIRDGSNVRIRWGSASVNRRRWGNRLAPEQYRSQILDAIENATGVRPIQDLAR